MKGKPVADALALEIQADVDFLANRGVRPSLAIVRIGARPDDLAYERGISKRCQSLGIDAHVYELHAGAPESEVFDLLTTLGENNDIHAIMPFRPMPKHVNIDALKKLISPLKDIDCIGPVGSAHVFDRSLQGFLPCAAEAVVEMLDYYQIPMRGARTVVLGRSLVVGRAAALLMLDRDSTVTVCHTKTKNIQAISAEADILISAIGSAKKIDAGWIKPGAVVIDVGINDDGKGGICGDVDFDVAAEIVSAITPVPGGVGSVTSTLLVRNVVKACKYMLNSFTVDDLQRE